MELVRIRVYSEFCSGGANASVQILKGGRGHLLLYYCINFREQQMKLLGRRANHFLLNVGETKCVYQEPIIEWLKIARCGWSR